MATDHIDNNGVQSEQSSPIAFSYLLDADANYEPETSYIFPSFDARHFDLTGMGPTLLNFSIFNEDCK